MSDIDLQELVINEAESDEVVGQQTDLPPNQIIVTPTGSSGADYYGLPVGSIFASAIPVVDARVHLLDGSLITQSGIYAQFATLIKTLAASGQPISCTQAEFTADVARTGNCGKFVIDDVNNAIRLPKITKFIQGLSSITDIGKGLGAGLPNITGNLFNGWSDASGGGVIFGYPGSSDSALYASRRTGKAFYTSGASHSGNGDIEFDASRSNAIYGNSNTVQPNATQFPYYIVLAAGYKQQAELEVDNIMNDINGLAGAFASKPWLQEIYPVGSIYISTNSKSPASLFGFGTWKQIKGRFLLGAGANDANTTTAYGSLSASAINRTTIGEMGGEIYHTLTTTEMPSHYHGQNYPQYTGTSNTSTWGMKNLSTKGDLLANLGANTTSSGGGGAHNNMPPYIVVYMWKRLPDDENESEIENY